MSNEEHRDIVLRRLSRWSFIIIAGISAVSLLGWLSGLLIISSISPDYIPIAPSTALCFSVLSLSLLIHVLRPEDPAGQATAVVCACLTIVINVILLVGYFLGKQFNIEHPGIASPISVASVQSGHMSPITAAAFLAASSAVLFLLFSYGGRRRFKHVASSLAMGVGLTGFIVVLGYLYGTPLLYGGSIIPVALPTGIAFMLTGLGLITLSGPSVLAVSVFSGPTVRSQLMRAFLPAITFFVLIEGLIYRATYTRTANPALLSSLIALVSIAVVSTIILKISKSIGAEIEGAHADLTRSEEAKRESDKKYKDLFDSSRDGVFQVNAEGVFVLINRAGAQIFGYESPDEIIGRNVLEYWREPKDRDAYRMELMMRKTVSAYPMKSRNKDGEPIELESSTRIIEDAIGTFLGIEGILRDVTVRKRAEAQVRLMAYYDGLTGLPNRTFYQELLHRAVLVAKRHNRVMAVLFIDLDHFKLVNDTFGHETGDKLLRAAADVIATCVRKSDYLARSFEDEQSNVVSRHGGDEFIVLLNEVAHAEDASVVAQRILRELSRPFSLDGHEVSVSSSIGIAVYPVDGEDPQCLIKNADAAMYRAKNRGRNNYQFYTERMNSGRAEDHPIAHPGEQTVTTTQPQQQQPTVGLEDGTSLEHVVSCDS